MLPGRARTPTATVPPVRRIVAVALVVLAACAGDDTDGSASSTTPPASAAATEPLSPGSTEPTGTTAASPTSTTPSATASTAPSTTGQLAETSPPTTARPPATSPPTTSEPAITPEGFERVAATATTADGTVCELCLWLADDGDSRALGLMYVTELGPADGMVFRYPGPTSAAFWMKNTILPLSIAFFDEHGAYLDAFDMEPCTADPCPTYPTPDGFVHAVEVVQGDLPRLGMTPGSTLEISDLPCPDP